MMVMICARAVPRERAQNGSWSDSVHPCRLSLHRAAHCLREDLSVANSLAELFGSRLVEKLRCCIVSRACA
jgi:hypothetical protein